MHILYHKQLLVSLLAQLLANIANNILVVNYDKLKLNLIIINNLNYDKQIKLRFM